MSHRQSMDLHTNRRKSVFTPNLNNININETATQTIELERLEQEITLKLQSIDQSFAKSHKIINDKLLPIIQKYHSNSKKIWSNVGFWKEFLEISANVELNGYEEAIAAEKEVSNQQQYTDQEVSYHHQNGVLQNDDTLQINEQFSPIKTNNGIYDEYNNNNNNNNNNDSEGAIMESTKTLQNNLQLKNIKNNKQFKNINTISQNLQNNPIMPIIRNENNLHFDTTDSILPPIPITANLSNTNGTDVNQTTPTLQRSNLDLQQQQQQQQQSYILHNNLDTNYKIQISPRKKHPHQPAVNSYTPKKPDQKKRKSFYAEKFDSSPFEIEAPKLQSDVQFSPIKPSKQITPLKNSNQQQTITLNIDNQTQRFPHTPKYGAGGQLLRTPNQISRTVNRYSNHGFDENQQEEQHQQQHHHVSNLDDSEQYPNLSPPVTLNFATTNNQTQFLRKTPTREVAHNIVKDVLSNVSGVNDSGLSSLDQPQFNLPSQLIDTTNDQDSLFNETIDKRQEKQEDLDLNKEDSNKINNIQEFDDFLDNKYQDLNKDKETDWSE